MIPLTEFGVYVKKTLIDLGQPQKWLIERVREATGKYMDPAYLHKIMTGRAASAPMCNAIQCILDTELENRQTLAEELLEIAERWRKD